MNLEFCFVFFFFFFFFNSYNELLKVNSVELELINAGL
jgi:hypothetical protein